MVGMLQSNSDAVLLCPVDMQKKACGIRWMR